MYIQHYLDTRRYIHCQHLLFILCTYRRRPSSLSYDTRAMDVNTGVSESLCNSASRPSNIYQ